MLYLSLYISIYIYIYTHYLPRPNKNPPPYKNTLLPPSKLIEPPSKFIVAIFASEGGYFMRGELVPPSKFIVTKKSPPRGGFLSRGGD